VQFDYIKRSVNVNNNMTSCFPLHDVVGCFLMLKLRRKVMTIPEIFISLNLVIITIHLIAFNKFVADRLHKIEKEIEEAKL